MKLAAGETDNTIDAGLQYLAGGAGRLRAAGDENNGIQDEVGTGISV